MRLRYLLIMLIFFAAGAGSPGAQTLPFRTYSIEMGLSESVGHALVQDSRGYLWIGTGFGLNRFDGNRFKKYYEENGLANNKVNTLFEDHDGVLWAGTDSGISVLRQDSLVTPPEVASLSRYSVLDIFQDREGSYWFGTDGNGVWRLGPDGQLESMDERYGLPVERVRVVKQTDGGEIWIGSREGLVRIRGEESRYYIGADGLPESRIRDLDIGPDGEVWIATRAGLALYDRATDGFVVYNEEQGLADGKIQTLSIEHSGTIWLGTESGISRFDGGRFENYGMEQGVPATMVYSSLIDREGNVWFGTLGGGVTLLAGNYFRNHDIDNGLPNNVVTGFSEAPDSTIWIATYGGGIVRYDEEKRELATFSEREGLMDNKVYTLLHDSRGTMWIGTRDGITLYEDGRFRELGAEEFPFRHVRKIFEIPENDEYWIATYREGVVRLRGGEYEQFYTGNGFLHNTVMDIEMDRNGHLWFATYGGVAVYDGEEFRTFTIADGLPSNGVIHIHIDHNNDKWFSTFNGIAKYNGSEVQRFPESEGTETIAYFTLQDTENNYYVGTNRGLYRMDPDVLLSTGVRTERLKAFRMFNQNQGLVANELNAGGSFLARDGTIWLGTVEGLSRFYPDRVRKITAPPGIEFEEIRVSGQELDPGRPYQLGHDQNFVEISYSGLSFESPDQVRYEYRMKGLDTGWQFTGERTIRYPSLSPGEYEFQIRAYNVDGLASTRTAGFSFTILAPFYLRWWFLLLVLLVVAALVFFFMHYFRVSKQVDIERMRVQIASDLHDDVGSSLTELALQTDFLRAGDVSREIKETLRQLGEHSRKIVNSLDDIVWSIDSRNDTAGDLTDRMQDYVNQIFVNGRVQVEYHFERLRPEEKLPVDVKENVYLIFKEAINNISKHSNATHVEITFSFSGKTYELTVHDNGNNIKTERKSGQGLRNIRMRAERIGSAVEISSGDGFTVRATGSIK